MVAGKVLGVAAYLCAATATKIPPSRHPGDRECLRPAMLEGIMRSATGMRIRMGGAIARFRSAATATKILPSRHPGDKVHRKRAMTEGTQACVTVEIISMASETARFRDVGMVIRIPIIHHPALSGQRPVTKEIRMSASQ